MSKQNYGDESNWKHEPHTEHHVEDKFGKGNDTRNWKKNVDQKPDETVEQQSSSSKNSNEKNIKE